MEKISSHNCDPVKLLKRNLTDRNLHLSLWKNKQNLRHLIDVTKPKKLADVDENDGWESL